MQGRGKEASMRGTDVEESERKGRHHRARSWLTPRGCGASETRDGSLSLVASRSIGALHYYGKTQLAGRVVLRKYIRFYRRGEAGWGGGGTKCRIELTCGVVVVLQV